MNLQFDFDNIKTTEFGIGRDTDDDRSYYYVPADKGVQEALIEMVRSSWERLQSLDEGPHRYEPSEKHASMEYVYLPLNDDLCAALRYLHSASNLEVESSPLSNAEAIFCYFARLTDKKGKKLTAVRRASQFKGVLKKRLIRFANDALKIVEDKVFKLDTDFDLLIDAQNIHILRPSGFEFVAQVQPAILAAVPDNVAAIQKDLKFVKFDSIANYASKHPRAARYLASIRAQEETKSIDKRKLKALCKKTGVRVAEKDGKVSVEDKDVMGFLEVLDRRRYEIELVTNSPEQYRAPSRQKLNSGK